MKDNGSEEVSPQQGEDFRTRFVPGVWRRGAALYELRYSSTGVPIFIEQSGVAFSLSLDHMERGEFALVEPGATLASSLFRSPEGALLGSDDHALLQLTVAALQGVAVNQVVTLPAGTLTGIVAAQVAWAALRELRRLKALSSEEAPR